MTSGRLLGQGGSTQTRLVEDAAGLVVVIVDPAGGRHEIHRDGRGNV